MFVGGCLLKDKQDANAHVASLVSSRNQEATQFYSRVSIQRNSEAVDGSGITEIRKLMRECVSSYRFSSLNGEVPQVIVYLRDNLKPHQHEDFRKTEIGAILQSFVDISPQYHPKLIVLSASRYQGVYFF